VKPTARKLAAQALVRRKPSLMVVTTVAVAVLVVAVVMRLRAKHPETSRCPGSVVNSTVLAAVAAEVLRRRRLL